MIGSVMPHKGIHVAVEAFRHVDPERATLDVWGDPSILPAYTAELRDAAEVEAIYAEILARTGSSS